jgi:hypothetical protein
VEVLELAVLLVAELLADRRRAHHVRQQHGDERPRAARR